MPFTFSHPAIVLPLTYLNKRLYSLTGLIIGSITPDFEYFLRMKVSSVYSHTWLGLFWFDLPLGFLLTYIYHNIVRDQFINNLPRWLNKRFIVYTNFNWAQYCKRNTIVVIISISIGIASHLFWDSFTHLTGYFVGLFHWEALIDVAGVQIPIWKIIQHLSTLIGSLIIIVAIYTIPLQLQSTNKINWKYWIIVTVVAVIIITIRLLLGLNFKAYWNLLVTALSAALIAVILTPAFLKQL